MSLRDELNAELKKAMKQSNKKRLSVLRMLLSEIKVAERSGKDFDEMSVFQSYAKKLRKSAEEYDELGREEKAAEVRKELAVVEEFLPEQMSAADIKQLVGELIEENDYGPRDIGLVMKTVMSEHGDEVDGSVVQDIAREKLAGRD
jgi:hypothetical protein